MKCKIFDEYLLSQQGKHHFEKEINVWLMENSGVTVVHALQSSASVGSAENGISMFTVVSIIYKEPA